MDEVSDLDHQDEGILEDSELLLELVKSIVRNPSKVSIDVARGKDTTLLTITVDDSDRGHVIGRDRKTIDAINHLFAKSAAMDSRRVVIQLGGQDVFKPREHRGPRPPQHHHPRSRDQHGPIREYRKAR